MRWFLSLPLLLQLLLLYIGAINLITFFYFGMDKLKSQLSKRRISENTLWLLSLVGGSLGALLGMHFFRHKTQKISFQFILAVILLLQLILILFTLSTVQLSI